MVDAIFLKDFFTNYSLPALIIGVVVAVITFVLNKFVFTKANALLKAQFPFILSVFIYIFYDMIFISRAFVITDESFYVGILSGSLSGIIHSCLKRIISGKTICLTPSALLIENILSGYFNDKSITDTAKKIDDICVNSANNDENVVIDSIKNTLIDSNGSFSSAEEIARIAYLIYQAVKSL